MRYISAISSIIDSEVWNFIHSDLLSCLCVLRSTISPYCEEISCEFIIRCDLHGLNYKECSLHRISKYITHWWKLYV
jgi:hypothetical protein